MKARYFAAETDFPAWLLYNNLTVCDLGGGTRWFSFRGHVVGRPSAPCVVDGGPLPESPSPRAQAPQNAGDERR